jgi:hypothetical protein
MKRWCWALLIFELVLFAIILILPQVALPDFTFHGGTAPVAARARVSSAPVRAIVAIPVQISLPDRILETATVTVDAAAPPTLDSRLSLLCTLLC